MMDTPVWKKHTPRARRPSLRQLVSLPRRPLSPPPPPPTPLEPIAAEGGGADEDPDPVLSSEPRLPGMAPPRFLEATFMQRGRVDGRSELAAMKSRGGGERRCGPAA